MRGAGYLCGESVADCRAVTDESLHHYFVVSPEIRGWYEPYEPFHDVVAVDATSKRLALLMGVKAMKYWPKEARADRRNPFSGVEIHHNGCEHNPCWCRLFTGQDVAWPCVECLREHAAQCREDYCDCGVELALHGEQFDNAAGGDS